MNSFQRIPLLLTVFVALGAPMTSTAEEHAHHGEAAHKLALDHGKKWQTDAPLRTVMSALREVYAEQLPAIHAGNMSASTYKTLGEQTEKAVASIVAECKLQPQADAMLHIIIAAMIESADVLKGEKPGTPEKAAHQVVTALNQYGQYFQHPDWKSLK